MNQNLSQNDLDAAITRSLEQHPHVAVPTDFAARVRSALPAQPAPRRHSHAGRNAAILASLLLTTALFLLAPHAAPNFTSFAFDLELLVLAQLGAIGYWFVVRREV